MSLVVQHPEGTHVPAETLAHRLQDAGCGLGQGAGLRQDLSDSQARTATACQVVQGILGPPAVGDVTGEAAGVDEFAILPEHVGVDENMLDGTVLAAQPGLVFPQRLSGGQFAQNAFKYLLIGVEFGDGTAQVLLATVAEQVQLRLVHPKDNAVGPNPMESQCRILEEVGKLLFTTAERFLRFLALEQAGRLVDGHAQEEPFGVGGEIRPPTASRQQAVVVSMAEGEDRQAYRPVIHGAGDRERCIGVVQPEPGCQRPPNLVGAVPRFRSVARPCGLTRRPTGPTAQADVDEVYGQQPQQYLSETATDMQRIGVAPNGRQCRERNQVPHAAAQILCFIRGWRYRGYGAGLPACVDGTLPQFAEHLVGRDEKGVFLKDAADNHHRMRPHNVHNNLGAEPGQVIRSAHGVVVLGQHIVEPGLVFHDVLNAGPVLQRPLHVGHQPGQAEAPSLAALQDLFDEGEHAVLVKVAFAQVGVLPAPDLELPFLFGPVYVDARLFQAPAMLRSVSILDNVERLIVLPESLFDEGQQDAIFLVLAIEEGADMAGAVEGGPGKPDVVVLTHLFLSLGRITRWPPSLAAGTLAVVPGVS